MAANAEVKRGSNPHTLRWLAFAYGVHMAVVDQRYDDAIVCMRKAPDELLNLLLNQPGLVLSNLFRFITCVIRFLPLEDPGAQQFLKVIKSLLKYGAACLGNTGSAVDFPSRHPIRLVLENLARLEDRELLMVTRRAWMVASVAGFDLMSKLAAASTKSEWATTAKTGERSQLPPSHDALLDCMVEGNEINGKGHIRLARLVNRAVFLRTLAEATGQERSLEQSVLEALRKSDEVQYNLVRKFLLLCSVSAPGTTS